MIIFTKENKKYITLFYNNSKTIYLLNKYRNFILNNYKNYYSEYNKFKDYFMEYYYNRHLLYSIRYYNHLGNLHKKDGPSRIYFNKNGKVWFKEYYLNNIVYSYEDYLIEINKLV